MTGVIRLGSSHAGVDLEPGDPERIGPFRLLGRLGAGGMGTVYLGVDDAGRVAAVKTVHGHLLRDGTARSRFSREAELSRHVSGACTAALIEADLDGSPPWLATEYVPGPTLADHVEDAGALDPTHVALFAAGLAEALTAIHSVGVTHRDLTPRNVILSPVGPKVVDFGIARLAAQTALTSTGSAVGTPGYLAPEVIRGDEATQAADVFAWASLVCFAAAARNPFGSGPTDQMLYRVLGGRAELPDLPERVRVLVQRAFSVEPELRPSSSELVTALTGHSGAAGDGSTRKVVSMLTARWDMPVSMTTIDISGLPQVTDRIATEQSPARSSRGWRRPVITTLAMMGVVAAGLGVAAATGQFSAATSPRALAGSDASDPSEEVTSSITLPHLTGEDPKQARADLRGQGLRVSTSFVDASRAQPGLVEGTDPPGGSRVDEGDTVTLFVARNLQTEEASPESAPVPVDPPDDNLDEGTGGADNAGDPPAWVYEVVAEQGFDVRDTSFWDPSMPISAVTGSFTGGATGRGMRVFFFTPENGYLGTDTSEPSETVWFEWRNDTTIAVSYALYRDGDPGCCPTGGAATVRYVWDGTRLAPADEIPPTSGLISR